MAKTLQKQNINYVISYAGRVNIIHSKGLNNRIGGFGGIIKMSVWLKNNKISHVVDASHPFAEQISNNAYEACIISQIPIVRLTRNAWIQTEEDNWQNVNSFQDAKNLLNITNSKIFLAIGRLNIKFFYTFPQHFYLLRMIEELKVKPDFPNYHCLISRGPFNLDDDISLLKKFKINLIISKNAGGDGAFSKIKAARKLKIPIIMIKRPILPNVKEFIVLDDVLKWLGCYSTDLGV